MTTPEAGSKRVVVVDDDAELRSITSEYLRSHGVEVIEATNGLEALLYFKRSRPAAVVLDLQMPRLGASTRSSGWSPTTRRFTWPS